MSNVDAAPSKRADVIWRKLGEESVVLNVQSEDYYSLNEVGTRIWELIDGQASFADIAATIAAEFEAPAEQIEADVRELVQELRDQGLVD